MSLFLTVSEQETLIAWAVSKVGCEPDTFGPSAEAVGVLDVGTGRIRAVMILNGFIGDAAVLHFATDGTMGWATRDIVTKLFGYIFTFKGLARVIGLTPCDNAPALKLAFKLGFQIEGRMRRNATGDADIMTSMFAEECHWLHTEKELADG